MKNTLKTTLLLLALAALFFPMTGCDSASNPIAPNNSVLTVVANPTKIGLRGETSTITITGFRPDGNPLSEGTLIILSTDLGTLSATSTRIDSNGRASVNLIGDGREGPATVTASLPTSAGGGGDGMGGGGGGTTSTATIQISEEKPQLEISANPSTIPVQSFSTITVLARDDDGFFLGAGETIILTSDLGAVPPSVETDNSGRATFRYRAGTEGGQGTVTAILNNSDPVMTTITVRQAVGDLILTPSPRQIQRTASPGAQVMLQAFVIDAQGNPQPNINVTFQSDIGTLSSAADLTDNNGIALVTLAVLDTQVSNIPENGTFNVQATALSEGVTFNSVEQITVLGSP